MSSGALAQGGVGLGAPTVSFGLLASPVVVDSLYLPAPTICVRASVAVAEMTLPVCAAEAWMWVLYEMTTMDIHFTEPQSVGVMRYDLEVEASVLKAGDIDAECQPAPVHAACLEESFSVVAEIHAGAPLTMVVEGGPTFGDDFSLASLEMKAELTREGAC